MKKIILIFFVFSFSSLLAQETLTDNQILSINLKALKAIDNYNNESKVTSKTRNDFYDLFSDNLYDENEDLIFEPLIVNDINPSPTFGEKISVVEYYKQMKTVTIFLSDISFLEIGSINPNEIDSGYVNIKVNKSISRSKYNEPSYNLKFNNITEKINYVSSNNFNFNIKYFVTPYEIICKINSITALEDLKQEFIFVPKQKSRFNKKELFLNEGCGKKPIQLDYEGENKKQKYQKAVDKWDKCKKNIKDNFKEIDIDILGRKINYFKSYDKIETFRIKIRGFNSPKLPDYKTNKPFVDLMFIEKIPVLFSAKFIANNTLDFGSGFSPTSSEYLESLSPSISIYPLKFNLNPGNLFLGVRGDFMQSSLLLTLDNYTTYQNSIDNSGSVYTRINNITDMQEDIVINQNLIFLSGKFDINNLDVSIFGNILLQSNNSINSTRNANAQFSGQYGDELFNVLISEDIEGEDFGPRILSQTEAMDLTNEIGDIIEIGLGYNRNIGKNDFLNLNLSISNQFSTTNWFEKSQSQISTTGSEFNSILSNTDLFNLNKYYINLAVIIKLI